MLKLIRLFFRPAILGTIAAGFGIINGANTLFGGGGGSGGGYAGGTGTSMPYYVPTGQAGADQQWQQMLAQMFGQQSGVTGSVMNPLAQSYANTLGINQQPLVQAGQQAGQQYGDLAGTAQGFSNTLGQQGMGQLQAGQDIYNLGRDPQNQLHDFLQAQTVDNSRAATSARGVGMSPYAAGIENDATKNFNMGWQNNQLGRAESGLQAMGGANQIGGADLSGAMGFGQQAPQFMMQSAAAPIGAQQQAYGAPAQAATQYAGQFGQAISGPEAGLMSQIIPYLNYGAGAGSYAGSAGLANAQFGNQMQTQGLERLLGGMQGMQGQMNTPGSWLSGMFGGGGQNTNYNSAGIFQPYYSGMDSGGSAFG